VYENPTAVLVGDNAATSGASVRPQHHPLLEHHRTDSRPRLRHLQPTHKRHVEKFSNCVTETFITKLKTLHNILHSFAEKGQPRRDEDEKRRQSLNFKVPIFDLYPHDLASSLPDPHLDMTIFKK